MRRFMFLRFLAMFIFAGLVMANITRAQDEKPANTKEVKIKTTAFCHMCKDKIENKLKKSEGVSDAFLTLKDKVVKVTYDPDKTTTEKLIKVITDLGYKAEVVLTESITKQ